MEELKLQWLRRLEIGFLGKCEEVKKGCLHPSGAEAPWSDCGGGCAHALQAVPPLEKCKTCFFRLLGQFFLHFMEGNGRQEKEKQNVFSLYITNTHCWTMHDRT